MKMNLSLKTLKAEGTMSKAYKGGVVQVVFSEGVISYTYSINGLRREAGEVEKISELTKRFDARGWEAIAAEHIDVEKETAQEIEVESLISEPEVENTLEAPVEEEDLNAMLEEVESFDINQELDLEDFSIKETAPVKRAPKRNKHEIITLKEVVDILREDGKIKETTTMKKVRRILRGSLEANKEGEKFRWEWSRKDAEVVIANIENILRGRA